MATRSEIDKLRESVYDALRRDCAEGRLVPGQMLPPVRTVAAEYGVSPKVAWQSIQRLVDEGILHTVPRGGTFVGRPPAQSDVYLLTLPHNPLPDEYYHLLQLGFEERIAQLGGLSLRLLEAEVRDGGLQNLPPLAGIFRKSSVFPSEKWWPDDVPCAEMGTLATEYVGCDKVRFDDIAGGRLATQHLMAMGHRKIGFFGLHSVDGRPFDYYWSREREVGWAQTMEAAGCSTRGLAFHPDSAIYEDMPGIPTRVESYGIASRVAVEHIIGRRDVTAVVAANYVAAESLLGELERARIPTDSWPAVLGFDDVLSASRSVVSYMHKPWDELGRAAAQILWERKTGKLTGVPVERVVPMRMISRMSCRPEWAAYSLTRTPTVRSLPSSPSLL